MLDYFTLKIIWWALVGVLLIGFAIMDGHDMGVGTLLPFVGRTDLERRVAINTVGPHWDGNQVWFITAGGALFAAWPVVYATAFSGFYWAMILVLWALFFRPVGFDYRSKIHNAKWRSTWDWGLFVGGAVPPLVFGIAFGNLLQGVPFHFNNMLVSTYTGSFWQLLNPFALLTGVVSSAMITLQGGTYLAHRTEGVIQARAIKGGAGAAVHIRYCRRVVAMDRRLSHYLGGGYRRAAGHSQQDRGARSGGLDGQLWPLPLAVAAARAGLGWRSRCRVVDDDAPHTCSVCRVVARGDRGDQHGRGLDVSLRHAVVNRACGQPDRVGQRVQSSEPVHHVLGHVDLHAADRDLHLVGLPRHARQGHRGTDRSQRTFGLLTPSEEQRLCGISPGCWESVLPCCWPY